MNVDLIAGVLTAHRWSPAKNDARGGCYGCAYHGDYAGWIAHITPTIDAELHPVIETVEQLDALPIGAVIRTAEGRVAVKNGYSWGNASGYRSWWSEADETEFDCTSDELDDLPATVIYTPEADRA